MVVLIQKLTDGTVKYNLTRVNLILDAPPMCQCLLDSSRLVSDIERYLLVLTITHIHLHIKIVVLLLLMFEDDYFFPTTSVLSW